MKCSLTVDVLFNGYARRDEGRAASRRNGYERERKAKGEESKRYKMKETCSSLYDLHQIYV